MRVRLGALAAAAALSLVLTACGPSAPPEPGKSLTEAPGAPQQHSVGDVVDKKAAEGLGTFSTDKNGAYEMPDGSFIVVNSEAPLPQPVRDDMARKVAELRPVTDPEDAEGAQASFDEFARLVALLSDASKKSVVVFTRAVDPAVGYPRWLHFGGSVSERVAPSDTLMGNNPSLESYEAEVFKNTRPGYFEVFYAFGGEA